MSRSVGTTANFLNSTALGSIGNFPRIVFTAAPTTYGDGVLGAWAISPGPLQPLDTWRAIVGGILATPLAPVAKDVASAIQQGSKLAQAWKK